MSEAFEVAWSLADASSAEAADTDLGASGTLTFGVSSETTQTQTLTFRAVADGLNEDAETLVLTLADPCADMTPCSVGGRPSGTPDTAYGMAFRLRQIGRSGLLTPYARFHLGRANTRWAAGLRLAELRSALQLGLEAALDRNSRNPANPTGTTTTTTGSSYNILLTGRLRF